MYVLRLVSLCVNVLFYTCQMFFIASEVTHLTGLFNPYCDYKITWCNIFRTVSCITFSFNGSILLH